MRGKLLVLALVLAAGGLSYYGGFIRGQESKAGEYDRGYTVGQSAGRAEQERVNELFSGSYDKLEADYNALVDDYNTLVEYANTPQYQPRQPISCTSYDYGLNSTSTTCY